MSTQSNGTRAQHEGRADRFSDAEKAGAEKSAENGFWTIPTGMEQAVRQIGEATERYGRTLGYSGEDGARLTAQSQQHMEAVKQCGTVLTKAFQDSSKTWMEMIQDQWKRNRDGMDRLTRAKTVQEFGVIQGELVRENLEHVLKDGRILAEKSMKAADEAGHTLASLTAKAANAKS